MKVLCPTAKRYSLRWQAKSFSHASISDPDFSNSQLQTLIVTVQLLAPTSVCSSSRELPWDWQIPPDTSRRRSHAS